MNKTLGVMRVFYGLKTNGVLFETIRRAAVMRSFRVAVIAALILQSFAPLVVAGGGGGSSGSGGISPLINFQGRLTDSLNNPRNGTFTLKFRIYNSLSGGLAIWPQSSTEDQTVQVVNGVFAVQLGAIDPIPVSVFLGPNTYLQITVDDGMTQETLAPRQKLLAAPYAFNAAALSGNTTDFFVSTAAAQSIEGVKTFLSNLIVSGANVGLGTDAPSSQMDVFNGSVTVRGSNSGFKIIDGDIRISTTSGGARGIYFPDGSYMTTAGVGSASGVSDNNDAFVTGDADANASGRVVLRIGSSERLVVANDGNIGVGTDTPSSKLEVFDGSITIRGIDSGLSVGSGPFVVAANVGFTGIGTYNPIYRLHVVENAPGQPAIYGSAPSGTGVRGFGPTGVYGTGNVYGGYFTNLPPNGAALVSDTGNVGLGTTSPLAKIHLYATDTEANSFPVLLVSTGASNLFEITGSSITLGLPLYFPDGSAQYAAATSYWAASSGDIYKSNAGNVGVGTQTPDKGLLDVRINGGTAFYAYSPLANSNAVVAIGNVGIGTAVSSSLVDIFNGSVTIRGISPGLGVVGGTVTANTGRFSEVFTSTINASSPLLLNGSSIRLMGGNVGIGVSNPDAKLQVSGTGASYSMVVSTASDLSINNIAVLNAGGVVIGDSSLGTGTRMRVAGGNHTISNPDEVLEIKANAVGADAGGGVTFYSGDGPRAKIRGMQDGSSSGSGYLGFYTTVNAFTMSEAMRISSSRKVGIGTTGPLSSLHVHGSAGSFASHLILSTGTTRIFEVASSSIILGGALYFPDGSSMSSAGVGFASGVNNVSDAIITADADVNGSGSIILQTGSGDRVTILSDGRVGVGTSAPDTMLHAGFGSGASGPLFAVSTGTTRLFEVNGSSVVSAVDAFKPGGGSWSSLSDERLKKNIHTLDGALERMLKLRGVTYEWKEVGADGRLPGTQTGVIAQEVEKVFPEWVGTDTQGVKYVTFRGFEALTIESMRRLSELRSESDRRIEKLELENAALKQKNADFEKRLRALEKK